MSVRPVGECGAQESGLDRGLFEKVEEGWIMGRFKKCSIMGCISVCQMMGCINVFYYGVLRYSRIGWHSQGKVKQLDCADD